MGEVFFRLHILLCVQTPQFDDLRQHLVDGEGVETVQPLFGSVGDAGVSMTGHDIGDVFKHLQREQIQLHPAEHRHELP